MLGIVKDINLFLIISMLLKDLSNLLEEIEVFSLVRGVDITI